MSKEINQASPRHFQIRFNRFTRLLFASGGHGPNVTYVDVSAETISVRAGWVFQADIPRASVKQISRRTNPWWNVGGTQTDFLGSWAVSGSYRNIVVCDVEPRGKGRLFSLFPVSIHRILFSLEEPEEFLARMTNAQEPGHAVKI